MNQTATQPVVDYRSAHPRGSVWTQTLAIFHDAYRELNARKLFWFVLAISGLVVAAFAMMGINERGITFLHFEFEGAWNTSLFTRTQFYKMLYSIFAIPFWLAWIATILAIVSTAGIFPDMLTGGSIDLYLAKPISRLRLFLTKYAAGLLFVALQVLVFSLASFLVIGIRGGAWEPGLFLAVPIVVLFFSYLFAICVLLGVVTRSTIAALLLTLLAWFMIWAAHQTEATLRMFRIMQEVKEERLDAVIARNDADLARYGAVPPASQPAGLISNIQFQREKSAEERQRVEKVKRNLQFAHRIAAGATAVLPKTSQTIDLLARTLAPSVDFTGEGRSETDRDDQVRPDDPEVARRLQQELRSHGPPWIIGSSLAFEAVLLALGAWVFSRRDF